MPSLRPGLGRKPFFQVAIARQNVGIVVHDMVAWSIEPRCESYFGDGHPDGICQSLPQGTRGGFDPGSFAIFRMARRATSPLAESLEFLERQIETSDMKQSVEECTAVSGRQHESVPVGPEGIARVELEKAIPKRVSHGRRTQGQARMTRLRLLNHVHGQEAERVDTDLIQCRWSDGCRKRRRSCHGWPLCLFLS